MAETIRLERRAPPDRHQRHPRLLEDRVGEARAGAGAVRPLAPRRGGGPARGAPPPQEQGRRAHVPRREHDVPARRSSATPAACARCSSICSATRSSSRAAGEIGVTRRRATARRLASRGALRRRDTGIGIPADRFDRLFESFSQADASTTRRLRRHRPRARHLPAPVRADGRPHLGRERGRARARRSTSQSPPRRCPCPRRRASDSRELGGKRVLIVDDNRTNRHILKLQAERWGMHARDTDSPLEALEWIRRGDPCDVALLDYQMPVMDGLALARDLRAVRGSESLPLVLLSSIGASLPTVQRDAVFAAVLSKPVRLSLLHDRLLEILGSRRDLHPSAASSPGAERPRHSGSWLPRTTRSTRPWRCGCSSGWGTERTWWSTVGKCWTGSSGSGTT